MTPQELARKLADLATEEFEERTGCDLNAQQYERVQAFLAMEITDALLAAPWPDSTDKKAPTTASTVPAP